MLTRGAARVAPCATPPASDHPLGPLLYRVPGRSSRRNRTRAALILTVCLALWVVGAALVPEGAGVGTHRQLGIPPCGLLNATGIPCPTCGMTTAFAHTARGRLIAAVATQPFGALTGLAVIGCALLSLYTLVTGRAWTINWYRVSPGLAVAAGAVLFLAAWAYKISVVLAAAQP